MYRRTLIGMLISIELIMNGAGLNLRCIQHDLSHQTAPDGMVFTLFIMGIAAAEAAIALAIIILIFRKYRTYRKRRDGGDERLIYELLKAHSLSFLS
ncbi:MAG: NADH-quinone oxidoreductase subunit K [Desulfomicrobium escambiense]|nr:NADH-quinone oxidoreductase subunit K [Desulfomicrobium escambiense]